MIASRLEAVFFDLDGTLLDTAEDIAEATNRILIYHGFKSKPFTFIRPLIGGGTPRIITGCFDIDNQHPNYNEYRQQLLQSYQQILVNKTQFFPGMLQVLDVLRQQRIPWGIITNKPYWLAKPLLEKILDGNHCHCLIGRETLLHKKPDPEPLRYACQLTGVTAKNSVYIGDAKSDIIAAKKANMQNIAAVYGYIDPDDKPLLWDADHIIHTAHDLLPWLNERM